MRLRAHRVFLGALVLGVRVGSMSFVELYQNSRHVVSAVFLLDVPGNNLIKQTFQSLAEADSVLEVPANPFRHVII